MKFVLDTDVVSYQFKGDTRAGPYRRLIEGETVGISFYTRAELFRWTLTHNWGKTRIALLADFTRDFLVLPPDTDMTWIWAQSMAIKGQPIQPGDAWIAAAALRYRVPLITHNRKHFAHIPGLTIISEAP
jgi:tRNA(fMet)-specific endonuclease VapC